MKTYRIGVVGLTHDHVWGNLDDLKKVEGARLVAVADVHPELVDRAKAKYECAGYSDGHSLLAREQLDAVYLFADNAFSAHIGEVAAGKGLHVLIEKPLAANLEGADRLLAAARRGKARIMVNWPFVWWPQLRLAIELASGGAIGGIWQVKYRAAHNGPRELGCSSHFYNWLYDPTKNGAGAYMDYCCYGVILARTLLGMPGQVTGFTGRLVKEDILVEDNGMVVMTYPRAQAIAEGSWSQLDKMTAYITVIYGTTGTLLVEPRAEGKLLLADAEHPGGAEVKVPATPPELSSASAHFIHAINTNSPFHPLCQDRPARDAQEILEAGLRSAARNATIPLPLPRT